MEFTKSEIEIIHMSLARLRNHLMEDTTDTKREILKAKSSRFLEIIPELTKEYQDDVTLMYKVFDLHNKIEDEYSLEEI